MATTLGSIIQHAREHLNEIYALVTPGSPLVSPQGTPGATTYSYKVVARNATGTTEASQVGTTTTGNAALSGTNFNRLTWTAVPYALTYDVYRTVGGATTGKIVSATASTTADDTGLAGDSATAPTVNTSGTTQAFWTDAELLNIATRGATDLWAAILNLDQSHFEVTDITNMSLAANATSITGVPTDLFRIGSIAPRDTTDANSARAVTFKPRKENSPDFKNALAMDAIDPNTGEDVFYYLSGAGSPVAAPTINTAPALSSALTLRVVYVPTLSASSLLTTSNNPIPGESDNALIAWTVSFALAKQEEDKSPHPGWLSIYSTEKNSLLVRLAPRQTQEPQIVEGMFEGYW